MPTPWDAVYRRLSEHCPVTHNKRKLNTADKCLIYLYCYKKASLREIAAMVKGVCCMHTIRNKLLKLNVDMRGRGGDQYAKTSRRQARHRS